MFTRYIYTYIYIYRRNIADLVPKVHGAVSVPPEVSPHIPLEISDLQHAWGCPSLQFVAPQ